MPRSPPVRPPKARARYGEIAVHLGLGGQRTEERFNNLVAWIDGLKTHLGIPGSIREAGIGEADFLAKVDKIALEAFDDQCTGGNPRFPLISELKALLLDSYYGRAFVEPANLEIVSSDYGKGQTAA